MIHYQNNHLHINGLPLKPLVSQFGSPLYVYDADDIRQRYREFVAAFSPLQPHLHYSVKANSNLSVLQLLHNEGAGFDIVSGGELARLQAVNIDTSNVSFAGVGKTEPEIQQAMQAGVGFFTIESAGELDRIAEIAKRLSQRVQVLLRLNPNVDAKTHRFITTGKAINKFGLDFDTATTLCNQYISDKWVQVVGFHMHLGSQIKSIEPYALAVEKVLDFIAIRRSVGHAVRWVNLGGGFGIDYEGGEALSLNTLAASLIPLLQNQNLEIIFEPGRYLVARAGVLLLTVQYVKHSGQKQFVIVDGGMHLMIRPALYGGWHKIWPVDQSETFQDLIRCDVVGPICESTDFLAQDRDIPRVKDGDVLALFDAGAYGFVMASNYNSHPRPAEVMVEDDTARLVRRRETFEDLLALEMW